MTGREKILSRIETNMLPLRESNLRRLAEKNRAVGRTDVAAFYVWEAEATRREYDRRRSGEIGVSS